MDSTLSLISYIDWAQNSQFQNDRYPVSGLDCKPFHL